METRRMMTSMSLSSIIGPLIIIIIIIIIIITLIIARLSNIPL